MNEIVNYLKRIYHSILSKYVKFLIRIKNSSLNSNVRYWKKISVFLDDIYGPLTIKDIIFVHQMIAKVPIDWKIVELNPLNGQTTCCVALACWQSRKKVYSLWPIEVTNPESIEYHHYIDWHKNILRKYLGPYVTPTLFDKGNFNPPLPTCNMIIINHDPIASDYVEFPEPDFFQKNSGLTRGIEFYSKSTLQRIFPNNDIRQIGNLYFVEVENKKNEI
jgi:hypothetical protein